VPIGLEDRYVGRESTSEHGVVALLRELRLNRCQAILYGWSPIVLKEYANTGHFDPLATLLVLAALLLLMRGRLWLAAVGLGMATLAKLYPLALALVLFRRLGLVGGLFFAMVIAVVSAPHLAIGPLALDGLATFSRDWEFNSSVFAVVEKGLTPFFGGTSFAVQVRITCTGRTDRDVSPV
jgi:hypothetical protein